MTEGSAFKKNVVVFCIDAYYFLPCAFLIEQLAKDPHGDRYDVAIVYDGVSESLLARLAERAGRALVTIPLRNQVDRLPRPSEDQRLSQATYFRLIMHEMLPKHYERILYLDSDMFIERFEIATLFDLDLGMSAFAAVGGGIHVGLISPEAAPKLPYLSRDRDSTLSYLLGLGIDLGDPYFNAGMLLIDRARWTALDIPGRALHFALTYPDRCRLADQSALNAVARGLWAELSLRWNYQGSSLVAEIDDAIRPVIRHFAGAYKPWNTSAWGARISDGYRAWLAASGWPGDFPAGPVVPTARAHAPAPWYRQLVLRAFRRRMRWAPSASPATPDEIGATARRAAFRHAVTAVLTFGRYVDLDPMQRRALAKAVAESGSGGGRKADGRRRRKAESRP